MSGMSSLATIEPVRPFTQPGQIAQEQKHPQAPTYQLSCGSGVSLAQTHLGPVLPAHGLAGAI